MADQLTIALSKGRIYKDTLPLLEAANIIPQEDPSKSRKLIIPTNHEHVRLLIVRATDAPTYVAHGAADIGVAGKDVLMEAPSDNLNELLDLQIAKCKLMVAGPKEAKPHGHRLKIATKYIQSAKAYYAQKGQQVDLIKLYGSMEIAPLIDLADKIVDLVDTGNTLKANGLVPEEHIADISSRLIVNEHAYKTKFKQINDIVEKFRSAI
ncbi:MAG: ATP phosphoribosyltransferase [Hydrogenovibrio crunogenus]|uniref:ATP phosphoribosyltransferase n=1 Tax=Hydrogenovibrio crunogenus (strain DSM 25203 / XCL-2) TaxID=317025 RepID=HIS1_HYDCU|nr:RecName: Full=ATP phosphoribosyltransferase; Short=ATP-PRT; Short=ATP-PRTase [Hydrogenovibrio crunogenus XCL-2]MBD3611755.1 ATP phosphoribosyltransferase [Hydrogenovibrio crunogenus]